MTVVVLVAAVVLVSILHPLDRAVATLLAHGVRDSSIQHLVMVPLGVLAIVASRLLIGLETFGLMGPLILAFAFERVGTLAGLCVFVGLLVIVTPIRWLLEHVPVLSGARTGFLVTLCALLLVWITALGCELFPDLQGTEMGLPVVAMAGLVDRFVSAQMDQSPSEAIKLSVYTLITATLVSFLVGWAPLERFVAERPDLLVLCLPAALLLGRYRGLRLVELVRFRGVPAGASE